MLKVYKQFVSYIKGSGLVYHGIGAGHLSLITSICIVLFMYILYTCTCTKKSPINKIQAAGHFPMYIACQVPHPSRINKNPLQVTGVNNVNEHHWYGYT